AARQVARAGAGPQVAPGRERAPQQEPLLSPARVLPGADGDPGAGPPDPRSRARAPARLVRPGGRRLAGGPDGERRVPVPEAGAVAGDPGAVVHGLPRESAPLVRRAAGKERRP